MEGDSWKKERGKKLIFLAGGEIMVVGEIECPKRAMHLKATVSGLVRENIRRKLMETAEHRREGSSLTTRRKRKAPSEGATQSSLKKKRYKI